MADHDSPPESLKVSDRRHFTSAGERRGDLEPAAFEESAPAPPPPKAPPAPQPAAEASKAPPPPKHERLAAREVNFSGLVQELYASGLMQLGMELQPGQPGHLDLEGARETIDLLGMLQQKTHGNLDTQEERLLARALYELRMAYVEVQRAATSRVATPPRR